MVKSDSISQFVGGSSLTKSSGFELTILAFSNNFKNENILSLIKLHLKIL